jgi:hypothetical protein
VRVRTDEHSGCPRVGERCDVRRAGERDDQHSVATSIATPPRSAER